jgi:hypothetical protein
MRRRKSSGFHWKIGHIPLAIEGDLFRRPNDLEQWVLFNLRKQVLAQGDTSQLE